MVVETKEDLEDREKGVDQNVSQLTLVALRGLRHLENGKFRTQENMGH